MTLKNADTLSFRHYLCHIFAITYPYNQTTNGYPQFLYVIAQSVKNLPPMQETWVGFLGQEDPREKEMATHSVFSPGESHGQRSLAGYSPWGRKSLTQLSD